MRYAAALALLVGLTCLMGCATDYQGAEPSYRCVGDPSEMKTDYVGLSFDFAVDQPSAYHAAEQDDQVFVIAQ